MRYLGFSSQNIRITFKWLNKKNFVLKCIQALVSTHQKNTLLHPFSWTVTVYINFSHKKISYWKIDCKNIRLRLKTLINNDFLLNGFQIIAQIKPNNELSCPMFETVKQFLLPFKVHMLDYQNFNSKNIRLGVKR